MSTKSIHNINIFTLPEKQIVNEFSLENNISNPNDKEKTETEMPNTQFPIKSNEKSLNKFKKESFYHPSVENEMKFTTKQYKNLEATHLFKDLYSTQSGELIANLVKVNKTRFTHIKNKSQESLSLSSLKKKPHLDYDGTQK